MHEELAQVGTGPNLIGEPPTVTGAGLKLVGELEGRLGMSCIQESTGKPRA